MSKKATEFQRREMRWLGISPADVKHILITHQDTGHVGAVEADSPGLFRDATLYIGAVENRYLTGEVRRRVIYGLYKFPQVTIPNKKLLPPTAGSSARRCASAFPTHPRPMTLTTNQTTRKSTSGVASFLLSDPYSKKETHRCSDGPLSFFFTAFFPGNRS